MFVALPLMIVPFIVYNAVVFASGVAMFSRIVMSVPMLSGAIWSMTVGDILILLSLLMLFIEVLKATLSSRATLVNHMASMMVFVAFLVEFLLVKDAATQLFFSLMVIALIDVVAGFTISTRTAERDIAIGL